MCVIACPNSAQQYTLANITHMILKRCWARDGQWLVLLDINLYMRLWKGYVLLFW
jgi:hypothetical protein